MLSGYRIGFESVCASNKFVTSSAAGSIELFQQCRSIKSGKGTTYIYGFYEANGQNDTSLARVDGGTSAPGYFTDKGLALLNKMDDIGVYVNLNGVSNALVTADGDFIKGMLYTQNGVLQLDVEADEGYHLPEYFVVTIDDVAYSVSSAGEEMNSGIYFDAELGALMIQNTIFTDGSLIKLKIACESDETEVEINIDDIEEKDESKEENESTRVEETPEVEDNIIVGDNAGEEGNHGVGNGVGTEQNSPEVQQISDE